DNLNPGDAVSSSPLNCWLPGPILRAPRRRNRRAEARPTSKFKVERLEAREMPAYLAGQVYIDANANGVFDKGEQGVSGVSITLTGSDIAENEVTSVVTTGDDGTYRFDNLQPGVYTISQDDGTFSANKSDAVVLSPDAVPGSAGSRGFESTRNNGFVNIKLTDDKSQAVQFNFTKQADENVTSTSFLDLNDNGVVDSQEGLEP